MRKVKEGDVVSIYCVGMLENGEIFEKTPEGQPFYFQVGSPEILPGLSEAVIGMEEGEEKEVLLSPEKAFGPRDENLIREIPREALSLDTEPESGMILNLIVDTPQGEMQIPAQVVRVDEQSIVLDLNPPLAGKNLIFRIKLVGIHEQEELAV